MVKGYTRRGSTFLPIPAAPPRQHLTQLSESDYEKLMDDKGSHLLDAMHSTDVTQRIWNDEMRRACQPDHQETAAGHRTTGTNALGRTTAGTASFARLLRTQNKAINRPMQVDLGNWFHVETLAAKTPFAAIVPCRHPDTEEGGRLMKESIGDLGFPTFYVQTVPIHSILSEVSRAFLPHAAHARADSTNCGPYAYLRKPCHKGSDAVRLIHNNQLLRTALDASPVLLVNDHCPRVPICLRCLVVAGRCVAAEVACDKAFTPLFGVSLNKDEPAGRKTSRRRSFNENKEVPAMVYTAADVLSFALDTFVEECLREILGDHSYEAVLIADVKGFDPCLLGTRGNSVPFWSRVDNSPSDQMPSPFGMDGVRFYILNVGKPRLKDFELFNAEELRVIAGYIHRRDRTGDQFRLPPVLRFLGSESRDDETSCMSSVVSGIPEPNSAVQRQPAENGARCSDHDLEMPLYRTHTQSYPRRSEGYVSGVSQEHHQKMKSCRGTTVGESNSSQLSYYLYSLRNGKEATTDHHCDPRKQSTIATGRMMSTTSSTGAVGRSGITCSQRLPERHSLSCHSDTNTQGTRSSRPVRHVPPGEEAKSLVHSITGTGDASGGSPADHSSRRSARTSGRSHTQQSLMDGVWDGMQTSPLCSGGPSCIANKRSAHSTSRHSTTQDTVGRASGSLQSPTAFNASHLSGGVKSGAVKLKSESSEKPPESTSHHDDMKTSPVLLNAEGPSVLPSTRSSNAPRPVQILRRSIVAIVQHEANGKEAGVSVVERESSIASSRCTQASCLVTFTQRGLATYHLTEANGFLCQPNASKAHTRVTTTTMPQATDMPTGSLVSQTGMDSSCPHITTRERPIEGVMSVGDRSFLALCAEPMNPTSEIRLCMNNQPGHTATSTTSSRSSHRRRRVEALVFEWLQRGEQEQAVAEAAVRDSWSLASSHVITHSKSQGRAADSASQGTVPSVEAPNCPPQPPATPFEGMASMSEAHLLPHYDSLTPPTQVLLPLTAATAPGG